MSALRRCADRKFTAFDEEHSATTDPLNSHESSKGVFCDLDNLFIKPIICCECGPPRLLFALFKDLVGNHIFS